MDDLEAALEGLPIASPTLSGARGIRVGRNPNPDPVVRRRNRLNRNRGKGTSKDLAEFLGGQNVETLGWPWDVQGDGYRIQSKRDQSLRGPVAFYSLLSAIPQGSGYIRAVYHVLPAKRLSSGLIVVLAQEWVGVHSWIFPPDVKWVGTAVPLLVMGLPVFREVHCAKD